MRKRQELSVWKSSIFKILTSTESAAKVSFWFYQSSKELTVSSRLLHWKSYLPKKYPCQEGYQWRSGSAREDSRVLSWVLTVLGTFKVFPVVFERIWANLSWLWIWDHRPPLISSTVPRAVSPEASFSIQYHTFCIRTSKRKTPRTDHLSSIPVWESTGFRKLNVVFSGRRKQFRRDSHRKSRYQCFL